MSDLTRDEIRQACEFATPWRWMEWGDGSWGAMDETCGWIRFRSSISHHADKARDWTADAIALLEAWRQQAHAGDGGTYGYRVSRAAEGFAVTLVKWGIRKVRPIPTTVSRYDCLDFPTAAVRAVNRAAEQPPQGRAASETTRPSDHPGTRRGRDAQTP